MRRRGEEQRRGGAEERRRGGEEEKRGGVDLCQGVEEESCNKE